MGMKPTAVIAAVGFVVSAFPVQYRYAKSRGIHCYVRTRTHRVSDSGICPAPQAGGEERSHPGKVSPGHSGVRCLGERAEDQQGADRGVEKPSGRATLRAHLYQRHALRFKQSAGIPWPQRLPGKIPEGSASAIPGR
jgi:hypothetical protein